MIAYKNVGTLKIDVQDQPSNTHIRRSSRAADGSACNAQDYGRTSEAEVSTREREREITREWVRDGEGEGERGEREKELG